MGGGGGGGGEEGTESAPAIQFLKYDLQQVTY